MAVLKGFSKQAVERKRYTLDYACWMEEGELLSDYTILVTPDTAPNPLIAEGAYVDPTYKLISTFLSGGAAGVVYTVRFIANTSAGQIKSDDIQLRVL
jgi:hypothetical protein